MVCVCFCMLGSCAYVRAGQVLPASVLTQLFGAASSVSGRFRRNSSPFLRNNSSALRKQSVKSTIRVLSTRSVLAISAISSRNSSTGLRTKHTCHFTRYVHYFSHTYTQYTPLLSFLRNCTTLYTPNPVEIDVLPEEYMLTGDYNENAFCNGEQSQ